MLRFFAWIVSIPSLAWDLLLLSQIHIGRKEHYPDLPLETFSLATVDLDMISSWVQAAAPSEEAVDVIVVLDPLGTVEGDPLFFKQWVNVGNVEEHCWWELTNAPQLGFDALITVNGK